MKYVKNYSSPIGKIILISDGKCLTELMLGKQVNSFRFADEEYREAALEIFTQAEAWLDIYFSGNIPGFMPPIHLSGTEFQMAVWEILLSIPYGKTVTYGEIADKIARQRGSKRMSAQAVGNAVGRNPIGIMIPCHRVIGKNGKLVGYAGGIEIKEKLLKIEKII